MSQITARQISQMLAEQTEAVAAHLLGSPGKREGQELRWGDTAGNPGKSLGVHISGAKRGVWADFATGQKGDLLDLWGIVRKIGIAGAIEEAKQYLGIRDVSLAGRNPKPAPISPPSKLKPLGAKALEWLIRERKLSQDAVLTYGLREVDLAIAFPLLGAEGELVGIKFRSMVEDKYWAAPNSAKVLFGWPAIPLDARSVLICEGELKALAWWDYGFPALSVPFGGGDGAKQDWIENEFDRLSRFDLIYVAMDEDEAGQKAAKKIVHRLGPERCAMLVHPLPAVPGAKCINACLQSGVSQESIAAAVAAAKPRDPDELKSAADYANRVAELFRPAVAQFGIRTPWPKVGDELVFRPGELTVIAGANGHGKSQLVGFMAANSIQRGYRVAVASLEFRVEAWIKRIVKQLAGRSDPAVAYVARLVNWLGDGRLWAFDAQGTANWRRMIDVFRYARRRYAIDLFVIDNLTGLGIAEEDYQGQKELALALSDFARDEDTHVWLVHHIRKGQSECVEPDKADIKGSGSLTDLASTVLTVWRNKLKERESEEALAANKPMAEEIARQADVRLNCKKQRNYQGEGSGEPSIRLWWGGSSCQYLAGENHRPRPLITLDRDDANAIGCQRQSNPDPPLIENCPT